MTGESGRAGAWLFTVGLGLLMVLTIRYIVWAEDRYEQEVQACEARECPDGLRPMYLRVRKQARCLCVQVPGPGT